MQSKVKLTKRQIKEDKFTTFMLTAKDRAMENWQFVAIGVLAVILVVAGISYYFSSQASASQEAGEKLAQAMMQYRSGQAQEAILNFTDVVENYGSDDAAKQATIFLAKVQLLQRNYSEAERYYQHYLDRYGDNPLHRAAAHAGIAVVAENNGNYAEAASGFEQAVQTYPDGPLVGDYLYGAMRNYLAQGDVEAAREKLTRIQEDYPDTEWENKAVRLFYEKAAPQT